jgi:hypothetical protein
MEIGVIKTKNPRLLSEGFHILARLAGFEPTTPWFVAKYSIQLSYSRYEEARLCPKPQCCARESLLFLQKTSTISLKSIFVYQGVKFRLLTIKFFVAIKQFILQHKPHLVHAF